MSFFVRLNFLIIIYLISVCFSTQAQDLGEWKAYTSVRTIEDITIDNNNVIWGATSGGVLSTNRDGEAEVYTTIEGISRLDGTTIVYDGEQNQVFVGYINGIIDVINLNDNEVRPLRDIERNSNFTSKQINDFLIHGRHLFVATDFGIVIYNMDNLFVEDSFIQIGTSTRGDPVNDVFISNDTLYAATQQGIGIGDLSKELSINTNWENFNESNSPISEQVMTVGVASGTIYASTANDNFIYSNGAWNQFSGFGQDVITEYYTNNSGGLLAYSETSIFRENGGSFNKIFEDEFSIFSIAMKGNEIIIGTANNGIGIIGEQNSNPDLIATPGPYQNFFSGLKFDGNTLIAASTNKSARNQAIDRSKGYYIFKNSEWMNYNQRTNELLRNVRYQQTFTTTITDVYYYIGSWGRGVARHNKDNDNVHVFDENNSTIRGFVDDDPLFPVISGLATDSNDDVWLVSRFGDTPLYYQKPGDDDWVPLPKATAVTNSDEYFGLFVDSFDQKWISLQSVTAAGNGLLVLSTGEEPENTSDDVSVKLTSAPNSGNLPDDMINAIIQDKNKEVWIGTGRGIARFIFPELIIDGGPNERKAQWLINEDTTATSRFLLRDVNVSTMAVNAANQKWIGSVNQGIWVLNAEGSRIINRFTAENSPLFSNNIISIAINDETGEVFIAMDSGLISYLDIPKAPANEMKSLKVYPNPFAYNRNTQIVIEGLSDETNLKIIGIDGTVVQEMSARGGRISWDGMDYNGNQLGSGVYYVVAYENGDRQTGIGKVVIVR